MKKFKGKTLMAGLCLVIASWQLGSAGGIHAKALLAQVLIGNAWQEALQGGGDVKPWAWADTWPVARLVNDKYGVDEIVLAGTSGEALAFGPGHDSSTVLPGEDGISVLGGHRDTHFEFLRELRAGDELRLQNSRGEWSVYLVEDMRIDDVRKDQLITDGDEDLLEMVTCYPFDAVVPGGPLRYVVTARRMDNSGFEQALARADTSRAVF